MGKGFESFSDLHGQLTTSRGVPYNEVFSTEEIRRLTFTRFYARRNQELSPLPDENKVPGRPHPVEGFFMPPHAFMNNWLVWSFKFFYYPSVTMAAIMTEYFRQPFQVPGFGDIPRYQRK